jgi:hypothetical protein
MFTAKYKIKFYVISLSFVSPYVCLLFLGIFQAPYDRLTLNICSFLRQCNTFTS